MTKIFQYLANICFPLRTLILTMCIGLAISFIYLLVFSTIALQEKYLTANLLAFLWLLLLYVLVHSFKTGRQEDNQSSWWGRFKEKLFSFLVFIYSVFFLLLILTTFYFTFKIITL